MRLGGQSLPAVFRGETVDFLDWAEDYVNQLDPLRAAERTGEFEEGSTYHFQNDLDRMKKAFGRLLGSDWAGWPRLHASARLRAIQVLRRQIRL